MLGPMSSVIHENICVWENSVKSLVLVTVLFPAILTGRDAMCSAFPCYSLVIRTRWNTIKMSIQFIRSFSDFTLTKVTCSCMQASKRDLGVVKWLKGWYTMAAKKRTDCVWILKDILKKKDEERSSSHAPAGAQPTFWMFTLPEVPKDDYNEVYSNILLGNRRAAQDKAMLKKIGVTHVVNTAQGTRFNQIDTSPEFYADVDIDFMGIPGQDVSSFKLCKHFTDTADFIDKALNSGGKVYIHCMQGVSRSATITISYLMQKKNMTVVEAVKEVRNKRAIFPNDGFLLQLCELNEKLYGLVKA